MKRLYKWMEERPILCAMRVFGIIFAITGFWNHAHWVLAVILLFGTADDKKVTNNKTK